MILRCIIVVIFAVTYGSGFNIVDVGPKYPPTKGEVWPKPQKESKENTFYSFDSSSFKIKTVGKTCDILVNAVQRYLNIFKNTIGKNNITSNNPRTYTNKLYLGTLNDLEISLSNPCEEYPHSEMKENYFLSVSTTSLLISSSIWGILRGLETFAQLLYLSNDRNEVYINTTKIYDYPHYKHRGLLLDTSRHYISLSNILKTIDAMAMNKMNVFHWHIVDDQSFPYESQVFPELSKHGAYNKLLVYTKDEIKMVVKYAKDRGIRVIPEIDVPGHTISWGNAHPSILTDCYYEGKIIGKGPMDPTNNGTYILLKYLLKEVQTWFPDKYIHLGGDEVQYDCWESNPKLRLFMKKHKLTPSGLHAIFLNKTLPLLAYNTKTIFWQEVFDEGINIPKDTLIHVWKGFWIIEVLKILLTGYKLIFSSTWYLSDLSSEWPDFYAFDPRQTLKILPLSEDLLEGIVGGEACMWGEMVDDNNILSRIWPRASAVAEKLWSSPLGGGYTKYSIPVEVYHRIEEHTCRMIQRSINAQPPNGPGYCI